MAVEKIAIRHLLPSDHESIVDYFLKADDDFLLGMGVDLSKLPSREEWLDILASNFELPLEQKKFFYMIWLLDGEPVGHSNINKIMFGEEAYTHLHMWRKSVRQKGAGLEFMKLSIPYYFNTFKIKNLFCEPYALNPAPNIILKKIGFDFIKAYDTVPGWINSHQPVNRWCLTKEKFVSLFVD